MSFRVAAFVAAMALLVCGVVPANKEAVAAQTDAVGDAHTVQTVSPAGTTINVFDYWIATQDDTGVLSGSSGINAGHELVFSEGRGNASPMNNWTNSADPCSGMVQVELVDGYPVLSDKYATDPQSLAYLFNSAQVEGKEAHLGVSGLLQTIDGYYEYNSKKNYAVYNAETHSFDVYEAPAVNWHGETGQFFPFDSAAEVFETNAEGELAYTETGLAPRSLDASSENLNHHFGVTMASRFVQPKDGRTQEGTGDPMVFEFSGDDDVWVYIDGVLIGDLGGIHDAASMGIDFSTGDVQINNQKVGTIKSFYDAAGRSTVDGFTGNTFTEGTQHALNFFYLERGASASNMWLKFNLVTIPESEISKVDSMGSAVEGAEFALYAANENYEQGALLADGITDATGKLTLVDPVDNSVITFDDLYKEKGLTHYLLQETRVPDGYRTSQRTSDGVMRLEYIPSKLDQYGGVLVTSNETIEGTNTTINRMWINGMYAAANVTLTAPNNVTYADDARTPIDVEQLNSGTLFVVIFKRAPGEPVTNNASWHAVSGDALQGYEIESGVGIDAILDAARKDPHIVALNASGQRQTEVKDLPGDITKYYFMLEDDEIDQVEFTAAVYFTTGSLAEATAENTQQVYSMDWQREFAAHIYVTNIQDRLWVQKANNEGEYMAGAIFALYREDQVVIAEDGSVTIPENAIPYDTATTQEQLTNPAKLAGATCFPVNSDRRAPLEVGTYYLKEIMAPEGYKVNDAIVKVVVDATGVHAHAGVANDGVTTFVGPGAVLSTLKQYAAESQTDNALVWIKGIEQYSDGSVNENGNLAWTTPAEGAEEKHLVYDSSTAVYQYVELGSANPLDTFFITDEGYMRMLLQQDAIPADTPADYRTRTDLSALPALNQLYTGGMGVRIVDAAEEPDPVDPVNPVDPNPQPDPVTPDPDPVDPVDPNPDPALPVKPDNPANTNASSQTSVELAKTNDPLAFEVFALVGLAITALVLVWQTHRL